MFVTFEVGLNPDNGSVWEMAFDLDAGRVTAEPQRLAKWADQGVNSISVSADGRRLVVTKVRGQSDVYLADLDRAGDLQNVRRFISDDRGSQPTGWSADSKTLLFASGRNGDQDVFRQSVTDTNAVPLVSGPGDAVGAQFSPDGRWLLYLALPRPADGAARAPTRLMRMPSSGGPAEVVLETTQDVAAFECPVAAQSPCGMAEIKDKEVIYTAVEPLKGRGTELYRVSSESIRAGSLSPSGRRVAYVAVDKDMRATLTVVSLSDRQPHSVPLADCPTPVWLAWFPDESAFFVSLYTLKGGALLKVDPAGHIRVLRDLRDKAQQIVALFPSPDGKRVAFSQEYVRGNAWLLESPSK